MSSISSKGDPAGEPSHDKVQNSKDKEKSGKAFSHDLKVEDMQRKEIKKLQQEVNGLRAKLSVEQQSQEKTRDEGRYAMAVARRWKIYTLSLAVIVAVLLISVYNLNRSFEQERINSQKHFQMKLEGATLAHERSTLDLQKKHEAEMSRRISDCQHEAVTQQQQYESKLNQKEVLCEKRINSYVSEVQTLQLKAERDRTSSRQELSELRKDCTENLHNSQAEHREQMNSLKNELSEQKRDCTANFQKSQGHYKEQITSLRHEHDTQQKDCDAKVLRCQVMNIKQQNNWERDKEKISRQLEDYQDKFERERSRCNDRGLLDNFFSFVGSVFSLFGFGGPRRLLN